MTNFFNNLKSEKMYQYLFEHQNYPFSNKDYRFLIIDFDNNQDHKKLIVFLEDLMNEVVVLKVDNDFLVFYFDDIEIEIKDLFSSISDDFGMNLKVFASGKMNHECPKNFSILYNAYKKHLYNKPYSYVSTSELILEIIKTDMKSLKEIKPVVLNKINDDSQMEKIILAMFDNNLNVTKTANDVYMHRNTIINKLDFIKSETNLNIQSFKDATCMYWIIKIK